jgi:predicted dehydrogenase
MSSDQRPTGNGGDATIYRVGIIGTGRPRSTEGATGFGMAGWHADGYNALPNCKIVALCDLVAERAEQFNAEKADGEATVYTDYHRMLAEAQLDIVSICTWPAYHAPMILAAAAAPGVKAIHSEKPIAGTWGDSRRIVAACEENGVQLTFNHQRRFLDVFQRVRHLLTDGAIGKLQRIEGACADMIDWGTHWLDMYGYYNDEAGVKWVMGQVDVRAPRRIFGLATETQGVSHFEYENGVFGTLFTGLHADAQAGCANRLIGDAGVIEVHWDRPYLRLRRSGEADWTVIEDGIRGGLHDDYAYLRAVADLVAALSEGRKPLLDGANALRSTEIIFATYESARRRGRIDAPLTDIDDNPLEAMIAAGVFPDAERTDASGG